MVIFHPPCPIAGRHYSMKTDVYAIDVRAVHALPLPFFVLTRENTGERWRGKRGRARARACVCETGIGRCLRGTPRNGWARANFTWEFPMRGRICSIFKSSAREHYADRSEPLISPCVRATRKNFKPCHALISTPSRYPRIALHNRARLSRMNRDQVATHRGRANKFRRSASTKGSRAESWAPLSREEDEGERILFTRARARARAEASLKARPSVELISHELCSRHVVTS